MAVAEIALKQYCPISYVGELNGVHYYLCEDCVNPPNTEVVGDDRMHDIGAGCSDCPDPIWAPSPHSIHLMDKGLKALIPDETSIAREARFWKAGPHVSVTDDGLLKWQFNGKKHVARAFTVTVLIATNSTTNPTLHPIKGTTHTPARIAHSHQEDVGGGGPFDAHDPEPGRRYQHKVKKGSVDYIVLTKGIKQ